MSLRRTPFRRLVVLFVLMLTALAATAGASQADPFGEVAHFADKAGELREPEAAVGVDQRDNSLYVVDQEKEGVSFRIQKFELVAGVYKIVASTTFKPKNPVAEGETEVQGVAIDPEKERVYVLALEERPQKEGHIDQFSSAASELYAFSTKPTGTKLEPATGTEAEGVLTNPKVLEPTSNKAGVSLLAPGGIAVNPSTHQILIAGYEDRGKLGTSSEETTPAVQAIEPDGKLGTRWFDEKGYFEECGCVNSPAVSSTGHIYVLAEEDEIEEIPSNLSPSGEVRRVYQMPVIQNCVEVKPECPYIEKLTQFPGEGSETEGSQMSIGPEGSIYLRARIRLASEENFKNSGVMVLSSGFVEQGFVGGGSIASESGACAVNDRTINKPVLAVGKEQDVFMLSRPELKAPKIVEFGPNGSSCPHGTATVPTAKAGGTELEKFPLADKVAFSSTMTQANAVSVEWEFGDGSPTEVVSKRQQEKTLVEHVFKAGGKFKVVEKIHTDNLATPTITRERSIEILGPPVVKAEEAKVEGEKATLKAEVNPNAENTICEFEYGPAGEAFPTKSKVACPVAPGEGEEFVAESTVLGLEGGKEYHFRLVAKSLSGKTEAEEKKFFVAEVGGPTAETTGPTELGSATATVNGKVNPNGVATTCRFEYGTTIVYGKEAPCSTAPGSGSSLVAVSASLTGLSGSTTYHFRLVAENSAKKKGIGADHEFKTTEPGTEPTAVTQPASAILQKAATLNGQVNPGGEPTECEFEYGTTLPSGAKVPCAGAPGAGRALVNVSATVSGLNPATLYKYRLIAKNPLGKKEGAALELTTAAALKPTAVTKPVSSVTQTAATLGGEVNPNGETTSCKFLYGTTTAYGAETACSPAPGGGIGPVAVAGALVGLAPRTVYHYRLVATSADGTTEGTDAEFTTLEAAPGPGPGPGPGGPPGGGVLPEKDGNPIVGITPSSIIVSKSGAVTLKLSCPKGVSQCAGTIRLRTLTAVAAAAHTAKAKKAILTLASATFTIAGGQMKTVTLHLSAKAKKLLAKSHTIKAKATAVAQNSHKESHTSTAVLALRKHR